MKRSTKYKLSSFISLALVLILYNQCVTPLDARKLVKAFTSTNFIVSNIDNYSSDDLESISIEAFKSTVYNLTRKNCLSCHDVNQAPLLASSDLNVAYNSLVTDYQIDFNDIGNSTIVLKLRDDHHHCWGECDSNANEIVEQIDEWKKTVVSKISQTSNTTEINSTEEADLGTITIMASSISLTPPMINETENGINYIISPKISASESLTSSDDGLAILEFRVSESDYYKVYMYVDAPEETSNNIFFKLSENNIVRWNINQTKGFEWRELKILSVNSLYIPSDENYILNIIKITKGLKISKIIISNNPDYNPITAKGLAPNND